MHFTFSRSGDIGVITFTGILESKHAEMLRDALMISVSNSEHLILDLRETADAHLESLKVICQVYHVSQKANKKMTLVGVSSTISEKILRTSDTAYSRCIDGDDEECLWIKEDLNNDGDYNGRHCRELQMDSAFCIDNRRI